MGFSLHIRRTAEADRIFSVRYHLASLYERQGYAQPDNKQSPGPPALSGFFPFLEADAKIDRWYIGDEFCVCRLPTAERTASFARLAAAAGVALTLLTPMVTDDQIEGLIPVFECLGDSVVRAEVTVNDWGLLFFLKEHFPGLPLALGRLLNKGFKDPRLGPPDKVAAKSGADRAFLEHATFDQPRFRETAADLGVLRLERDLMPYGFPDTFEDGSQAVSVYFPFGYVTTGRACWPSTFASGQGEDFMPRHACGRTCEEHPLTLRHPDAAFRLRQNGNTIFYLYPQEALAALFRTAEKKSLRLVYQGAAL